MRAQMSSAFHSKDSVQRDCQLTMCARHSWMTGFNILSGKI